MFRLSIAHIVFLFLFSFSFVVQGQDRAGDSLALVELYDSCNGEEWKLKANWKSAQPIDTWQGVIVNNDRVETLRIGLKGVKGKLPESIGNLTGLRYLVALKNSITALPETIGNLKRLQSLQLTINELSNLPGSFSDLDSLHFINLEDNNLEYLPDNFGQLILLDTLLLKNNSLDSLPESFANLNSLKKLDLDSNSLIKLPENIGDLDSITYFTAQANSINNLPATFGSQNTIQYLFLNNNNITSLPNDLSGMDSIKTILLINNDIDTILSTTFQNVVNLERLDLRGNSLSTIPETMVSMSSLNHLDLGDNRFEDIPEALLSFSGLTKLLLDRNALLFDDMEYLLSSGIESIGLEPQDSIGITEHVYSFSGRMLTFNQPTVGTQNKYHWYLNGSLIDTNNETSSLHFDSLLLEDAGVYNCHVKNDSVTGVTLLQRPVVLHVIKSLDLKADSLPHAVNLRWINPEYANFSRYIIAANDSIIDTLDYDTITDYLVEGLAFNEEILFTLTIENVDGSVSLKDSVGGTLINVTPVIDSIDTVEINEDGSFIIDMSLISVSDPDDSVFLIQVGNGENYSFLENEIFPHENFNGDLQVNLKVSDGFSYSSTFPMIVKVVSVNDNPFVKYPIPDTTFNVEEGTPFYVPFPDSIFEDIDIKDSVLSLSSTQSDGSVLPGWLTFGAGYFSGNPVYDGIGYYEITVIAEDSEGATASVDFKLTVDPLTEITPIEESKDTNEFICYPNPVNIDNEVVYFQFPSNRYKKATISICTSMGAVLDRIECNLGEVTLYSWDMKNENGIPVGSGTYVIMLQTVDEFGNCEIFKKSFGVSR